MSPEEQNAAMEVTMQNLKETREMKKLAAHNVPLNAFHDARKSLDTIDREVKA